MVIVPVVSALPILVTPEPTANAVPMFPPKVTPPVEPLGVAPSSTAFKSIVAN